MTGKLIATLTTENLLKDTDQFNNNCIEMRKSQIKLPNKIVLCDSGQTQSTHRPQIRMTEATQAAGMKGEQKLQTEMILNLSTVKCFLGGSSFEQFYR